MAIQSLTSTQATASPTSDPNDSNQGADLSNGNSVPFSFLIAFLALFVVFMGLGLWARRIVFFARRQLGLPVPEPPQRRQNLRSRKPVLWDVYPDGHVQPEKWVGMEPLSSWYCREVPAAEISQPDPELTRPWPPPSPMHQRMPRRGGVPVVAVAPLSPSSPSSLRDRLHPLHSLREWWLDIVDPMRHSPQKGSLGTEDKVDQLQVAMFISMPSQDHGKLTASSGGAGRLGELAIGIADLPWSYDDSALNISETRT